MKDILKEIWNNIKKILKKILKWFTDYVLDKIFGPDEDEPEIDLVLKCPDMRGWDSQPYSNNHKGLDFGWLKGTPENDIVSCLDGIVEFEGFYEETIGGKKYRPIGVIIRHPQYSNDYDLVSIYWHLSKTIIDKGMNVKKGQVIGNKGTTGCSTGNHLHFQLIKVDKGAEIPPSYKWADISIDPTPLLVVYNDQEFDYRGNYKLKKEGE